MASERAMIAAELTAQLSEILPKRQRKRLAERMAENAVPAPEPPQRLAVAPEPSPDLDELTPSRRPRRPVSGSGRQATQRRPDPTMAAEEPPDASNDPVDTPADAGATDDAPELRASVATRRSGHRPSAPSAPGTAKPKRPARKGGRRAIEEARQTLGEIKGVGPARQDMLLEAFGDLHGVAAADVEDLAALPGITDQLARAIKRKAGKQVS
jgi:hypothetical protein